MGHRSATFHIPSCTVNPATLELDPVHLSACIVQARAKGSSSSGSSGRKECEESERSNSRPRVSCHGNKILL